VHQHWQNQVIIADAAVEQAIATQQLAMEKEKEAKTRLDEWKLKSERCEKRKRQSCVNSNVTGFGTIMEKITKTLREAEEGDREIDNILNSFRTEERVILFSLLFSLFKKKMVALCSTLYVRSKPLTTTLSWRNLKLQDLISLKKSLY
jgi:hypothetical protein